MVHMRGQLGVRSCPTQLAMFWWLSRMHGGDVGPVGCKVVSYPPGHGCRRRMVQMRGQLGVSLCSTQLATSWSGSMEEPKTHGVDVAPVGYKAVSYPTGNDWQAGMEEMWSQSGVRSCPARLAMPAEDAWSRCGASWV